MADHFTSGTAFMIVNPCLIRRFCKLDGSERGSSSGILNFALRSARRVMVKLFIKVGSGLTKLVSDFEAWSLGNHCLEANPRELEIWVVGCEEESDRDSRDDDDEEESDSDDEFLEDFIDSDYQINEGIMDDMEFGKYVK
nr:uncharacterized protein LOC109165835 [Ipomoea batatas]